MEGEYEWCGNYQPSLLRHYWRKDSLYEHIRVWSEHPVIRLLSKMEWARVIRRFIGDGNSSVFSVGYQRVTNRTPLNATVGFPDLVEHTSKFYRRRCRRSLLPQSNKNRLLLVWLTIFSALDLPHQSGNNGILCTEHNLVSGLSKSITISAAPRRSGGENWMACSWWATGEISAIDNHVRRKFQ